MRNKISNIWLYCNHKSVVVGFRNKDCWYNTYFHFPSMFYLHHAVSKRSYTILSCCIIHILWMLEWNTNYFWQSFYNFLNQYCNRHVLTRHWINAHLKQNTIEVWQFSWIPYILSINTSINLRCNYLKWMTWFDHYCVASVYIYSPFTLVCRNT